MDLSKLPEAQRKELEQLQKQFQEHQQKQQQESAAAAATAAAAAAAAALAAVQQPPPAYDPSQINQSYDPSQAYDQSYYYNYNYHDPSQQHQQYDASYYQNYYANAYQQPHQYTHQETLVATAAASEQQPNAGSGSGSLASGQVQDPYAHPGSQVNLVGTQPNPAYPIPPGLNAAAAAAVAALSQLTQFAGTMGAAERANGGAYIPPMTGGGHFAQGHFRPPIGYHPPAPFRGGGGGGRRGGGPFRGGMSRGFRPPNSGGQGPPFQGRGRGGGGRGRGRGRGGRPSSHPIDGPQPPEGGGEPSVKIAWCELCRVDCNSKEILETHNHGKRHQKNLQRLQEMKGEYKPLPETEKEKEVKASSEANNQNVLETETKADEEKGKKPWMKRKVKGSGGRGGKRQRQGGVGGPQKGKVVIPLMCDLCNVKCDTQEVFDRHVGGKKHIAKLKRFQGHQAMYGPTAVQALYPPNPLAVSSMGPTHPPAYVPPENPNPQLADAPLQFTTQNVNVGVSETQPQQASTTT